MALAYKPPGVSIDELVNPTFQPFLGDPTSICIVGPARGYEVKSEYIQLLDDVPVALSVDNGIDVTGLTVKSADGATTYTKGTATGGAGAASGRPSGDYYVSGNEVIRSMATDIQDDDTVVVIYGFSPDNGADQYFQEEVTLDLLTAVALSNISGTGGDTTVEADATAVQSKGILDTGDYAVDLSNGDVTVTGASYPTQIFPTDCHCTLWFDYTDENGNRIVNEAVAISASAGTLANTPDASASIANVVARNTSDLTATGTVVRYGSTSGATGMSSNDSGADFLITAANNVPSGGDHTFSIARADVVASNIPSGATVRVNYVATPSDYYVPTQVFSLGDVEDKYGPALDNDGNVVSPVTLAAGFAFANGATDMVIQALFHDDTTNGIRTAGGIGVGATSDSLNLADWEDTLAALRDVNDVNVVVPLVSAGPGNYSDSLTLSVFLAVQAHINYMIENQDEYLVAICGEDSTVLGVVSSVQVAVAAPTTLQSHATALAAGERPEVMTVISPASFQYASQSGASNIGGQYVAAMVAGRLASQDVQIPLTRRTLIGLTAVNTLRSEREKDSDAQSGLFVIENKRGIIQVRHAITVAVGSNNTRELSVIRAKGYMIENVKNVIDNQIIGQIIADDRAAFTVQTLIEAELDSLVVEGAIVTFRDVQARLLDSDPSTCEVRFSYLPAFPLNYVNIVFSINTASGVVTTSASQGL